MKMADMSLVLADWILVNSGLVTDPVTAASILAIPEMDRTPTQQVLWLAIQNTVVDLAENGPRPNTPYISMHMEVVKRHGLTPYRSNPTAVDPFDPSKGVNTVVYYIESIHLFLQGYGSGTNNNLQNLQQSLMKDGVLETLRAVGLSFWYDSGITDIHIPIDMAYENRWAYDLVFSVGQEVTDTTMDIASVPYTFSITH